MGGWDGEFNLFRARLHIEPLGFLCSAFVLGGLAFLNTWDVLFGFALLAGVYVLKRASVKGWRWKRLTESLALLLPVGLLAILLYLPFYIGFSSQASGILPNLDTPTRGAQLWVFWGALFLPVAGLLAYLAYGEKRTRNWLCGLGLAGGLFLILWIFSWLLAGLILVTHPADIQKVQGSLSLSVFFGTSTLRRLTTVGGWLSLLALIGVPLAFLVKPGDDRRAQGEHAPSSNLDPMIFVLLLVLIGGLLILAPEFFFLRDIFTSRMNTIFKFYYQAWLLFSLSAAFGVVVLAESLRGAMGVVYRVSLAVMLVLACTYPVLAILVKTNDFKLPVFQQTLATARSAGKPSPLKDALAVWTLDGAVDFNCLFPDDAAAVRWLTHAPFGVLVEATKIDASYTDYAHISTYSGLPAVLGWPMHEDQWRGTYAVQGTRLDDIQHLYETSSWQEAQAILKKYDIRYVFIGTLERQNYRVSEDKFKLNLHPVFTQNGVIVYEVPGLGDK